MDASQIGYIWGIVALICGAFMLTYGATLFRFVLAFAGFYLGFTIGMALPVPSQALQIALAFVLGGALAALLYFFVKFTLYLAGGLLGLVIGFLLASVIGQNGGTLGLIIGAAGGVLGAVFGRSLGDIVTVLAAAAAGAYVSVIGLSILFTDQVGEAGKGMLSVSLETLSILIVLFAVSVLAQMQIVDLRRRLRR